jgi:hypothetical protein
MTIKDSGTRTEFTTGAVRDAQEGKGRMDLLPVRAIIEVAKVFEEGAKKYGPSNWRKGIPLSRFMDSGLRHAMKWLRGDRDEPHLAQACWNFMCLLETQAMIEEGFLAPELNDLAYNPLMIRDNPLGIALTTISRERTMKDFFDDLCGRVSIPVKQSNEPSIDSNFSEAT